jgi:5-methylcytosine-specific restriction endonuclease McrA
VICFLQPGEIWQLDHLIPLSSNELNKRLRALPRVGKAKVARQSFGSNHADNLILACKRCNAFKKHRLLAPAQPGEPRTVLTDADWRLLAASARASAVGEPPTDPMILP